MSSTMKEARVYKDTQDGLKVQLHEVPVPTPTANQVLIKVIISGSNPKDWKIPLLVPKGDGTNSGDDIAGTVEAVGSEVSEFHVGDRVAAFHVMMSGAGSFAEYAIAPASTTFHIPEATSYEEAATIPLAAMTAAVGLFTRLGLPEPWVRKVSAERTRAEQGGIIVYGAASAVGAFAVKLLVRADLHPIICVAGRGMGFVESLIDRGKGDTIVDYRDGDEKVVKGLAAAVPKGNTCAYAFDAVSEHNSFTNIVQVLDPKGHITLVLPGKKYPGIPESVNQTITSVGSVHQEENGDFGFAWFRLFGLGLAQGWFKGHPYEVLEGGLMDGVQTGLRNLMNGKASAVKYVFRVDDTPGLQRSKI